MCLCVHGERRSPRHRPLPLPCCHCYCSGGVSSLLLLLLQQQQLLLLPYDSCYCYFCYFCYYSCTESHAITQWGPRRNASSSSPFVLKQSRAPNLTCGVSCPKKLVNSHKSLFTRKQQGSRRNASSPISCFCCATRPPQLEFSGSAPRFRAFLSIATLFARGGHLHS